MEISFRIELNFVILLLSTYLIKKFWISVTAHLLDIMRVRMFDVVWNNEINTLAPFQTLLQQVYTELDYNNNS